MKELGFKGALINGQTNGHYLEADMYLPFWEQVQEMDVPIYLHPAELVDQPAMFVGRPELNGAVWAWTAETASHALRLVFGGTFTRFPKLKNILGHMGETLPFLLWRFDSRWQCELGKEIPPDEPRRGGRSGLGANDGGIRGSSSLAQEIMGWLRADVYTRGQPRFGSN